MMNSKTPEANDRAWSFEDDLAEVFERSSEIWPRLRGARIFLTGGTGFIGCWLLESLRYADLKLDLDIEVTVLTRDPEAFSLKAPHLAGHSSFHFLAGDICDFSMQGGDFSHLIHAATDASADLNENDPRKMFDTVVTGTRKALDLAVDNNIERVLFLSSGAVYGQQPWEMENVSEDWSGSPDCTNPRNAYAEGKRAAEMLCAIYRKQFGLSITTARIFALLGPYISLDIHFAAGNFIRDAMNGKTVVVNGNGQPVRSYLYASDLTVWLWNLLLNGADGTAYNVGSAAGISIRNLAKLVAEVLGSGAFVVKDNAEMGWNPGRYVPDTRLATSQLALYESTPLKEAIRRTALWNGWNR